MSYFNLKQHFHVLCTGSLLHSSFEPSVFELGASGGGYAIMTAVVITAIIKRNELTYFVAAVQAWPDELWLWLSRTAALFFTFSGLLMDLTNLGHLGGAATGLLMGLTELRLRGPHRFLFIFVWLIVILVWVRIISNQSGGITFLRPT